MRPESLALLQTMLIVVPLAFGGLFLFVAYKVVQARRRKPLQRAIMGGVAVVVDEIAPNKIGFVRLEGELWQARSHLVVQKGSRVRVVEKDGPVLIVEPAEGEEKTDRK